MKGLRALLRWPDTGFPHQLLTGQPVIDDYLKSLDAELWGTVPVRTLTLAEVRAHLLDQWDQFQREGRSADEAAALAVERFGSAGQVAAGQHAQLKARFKEVVGESFPHLPMVLGMGVGGAALALLWMID